MAFLPDDTEDKLPTSALKFIPIVDSIHFRNNETLEAMFFFFACFKNFSAFGNKTSRA